MKKIITCVIVFFLWACHVSAAPCYGTKLPKRNTFFAGVQNYTIFKRYLENEQGKIRSMQDFLLVSYGVCDWLSLDLKGGAGYIKQHPVGSDELHYPSFMGGGYGFRIRLYGDEKTKAVFGFQHISIHPHQIEVGDVRHKAVLDDWQTSVLVSRDLFKVTPYLGVKFSRTDYIHWRNGERKRIMSDLTRDVGAVFGIDIPVSEKIWINLEGQAADMEGMAFSVNYKF